MTRPQTLTLRSAVAACALILIGCVWVLPRVAAQFFGETGTLPADDPGAFTANVSPYVGDRFSEAMRHIEAAATEQGPAAERTYRQAWEALKPVVELPDLNQTLAPGGELNRWDGVAGALVKLVKSLPQVGLESYCKSFRGRSLGEFELARDKPDRNELAGVVLRYPMTEGGQLAARMLGRRAWEQGDFPMAAWAFSKLWEQHRLVPVLRGVPGDVAMYARACSQLGYRSALVRLKSELGTASGQKVLVGKESTTLGELVERELAACNDELNVPTSDEDSAGPTLSRSGLAVAPLPVSFQREEWKVPLPPPTGPLYREMFAWLPQPEAPAMIPAVHGSSVLVNSGSELTCIDLFAGNMVWSTPAHAQPRDAYHLIETDPNLVLTACTLGTTAFAALENPLTMSAVDPKPQIMGLRPFMPMVRRSLAAVDLVTGRLQWVLGGQYSLRAEQTKLPALEQQAALTSFHHAAAWRGVVYAVGAQRQNQAEVFLFAVDPASGRPLWRLSLCQGQVENTMFGAAAREPFPGIPLIAGGRLYVASNLGGVVAVDLASRSIAWISRHESQPRPYTRAQMIFYRKRTFLNSPPVLAATESGRELLVCAPTDSRHVFALDAATGTVAWQVEVEDRQSSVREFNDAGPSVLIGVDGGTVHVGHADRHVRISLDRGTLLGMTEVMTRTEDGRGVSLKLTGRPAIAGGTILWPGADQFDSSPRRNRVATIPASGGRPGVVTSVAWPREPGNLLVRRGILLCQHGRDYIAGLDPNRSGDRSGVPTLSAHFDLSAMLASVRAALQQRPDDPEVLIEYAMLSGQLMKSGGVNPGEIEQVLMRALDRSVGHPRAARIADMARRGLFDQAMARAAAALGKGDRKALDAALVDAEKFVTSANQQRDIFLFRESGCAGDNAALVDLYTAVIAANPAFLLTQGEHRLPAARACLQRRADRLERMGDQTEAVADIQDLLAWTLTDRTGEGLRRDLIVRIHDRIRQHGPSVYSAIESQAAAALERAGDAASAGPDGLRAVVRMYPNSAAAVAAAIRLMELREKRGEVMLLADDFDREFELRGADAALAPVWIGLLEVYRRAGMEVSAYVTLGRAARIPAGTSVTVDGVTTTMGDWVSARRRDIREKRSQNLHGLRLPVGPNPSWVGEYAEESRMMLPEQPLGFPGMVFLHGSMNDRTLTALDSANGNELWRGPEVIGNVQLQRYGGRLIAMDMQSVLCLEPDSGQVRWTFSPGGTRIWTEFSGGIAVSLTIEPAEPPKGQKYMLVALNCQSGDEAWRTEIDPTNQSLLTLGDHSIYAVTSLGNLRTLVRIDLASGEAAVKSVLSVAPSSFSPVSMTAAGQVALVNQNGDVELRDGVSLDIRGTIPGAVRSVRHVWPDSGLLVVIGNSGDCAAYDPDALAVKWALPAVQGAFVMNAEVRSGRVVMVTIEQSNPERPHVVKVLRTEDGGLVHREVICKSQETRDGETHTWSLHHEKAVFAEGMAISLMRQAMWRDESGAPRQRHLAPTIAVIRFSTGEVSQITTWEPSAPHLWPMNLRSHEMGLLFLLTDRVAMHPAMQSSPAGPVPEGR